jgi:integrase
MQRECRSLRERVVPVNQSLAGLLESKLGDEVPELHRLIAQCAGGGIDLGDAQREMTATNAFARLAKKAGLSTTSLHSTHANATTLVRAGVDLRTVSSIMRHSNASVTLGIYGHVRRRRRARGGRRARRAA